MAGPRQEQQPASDEVVEVAPGVLRMQLPVDLPGLGHVNCYALEDDRGLAVVDPGLPGDASWEALLHRLAQLQVPVSRIHTVVVTHSHPDHFGLAARIQDEGGADLVTHETFRTWWTPEAADTFNLDDVGSEDADAVKPPWERPTPWGTDNYRPPMLMAGVGHDDFRKLLGNPVPTVRLEDADVLSLGGSQWVALYTPGHSPDHLCLLDPVSGVLFSGDHVLPTITPHISGIGPTDDPLADFFRSLDRMLELDHVTTVLPAHGLPFDDLKGRVVDIKEHHEERLERLRTASQELGRDATVEELSQHLFKPRAWGPMAESETYAHLEHLRLAGQAERHDVDGLLLYSIS